MNDKGRCHLQRAPENCHRNLRLYGHSDRGGVPRPDREIGLHHGNGTPSSPGPLRCVPSRCSNLFGECFIEILLLCDQFNSLHEISLPRCFGDPQVPSDVSDSDNTEAGPRPATDVTTKSAEAPGTCRSSKGHSARGLPREDPQGARDYDDMGPCTRHPPGIQNPRQRQREEKSGRQTKNCPRSASTLPVPKCTGDADRRFSPLPGGRQLHWAAIRSDERPASPYSVRYEFCRRDNSEHIRG